MAAGGTDGKIAGALLRQARQAAGLTQEELADKTGLSVRTLGDLERGRTARPHRKSLELLAEALGLPDQASGRLIAMSRGAPDSACAPHAERRASQPSPRAGPSPGGSGGPSLAVNGPQWSAAAGGALEPPAAWPARKVPESAAHQSDRAAPAQLPTDIPDFTGRDEQVARLCDLLSPRQDGTEPGQEDEPAGSARHEADGAVRVVLVVGAGGVGKTALAVHAAHALARRFPHGQLFASLRAATQPVAPAEVLARFLRDLGVDAARIPADLEERAAQYRTVLAGRQVLIVLDDARNAAQVQTLLPGSGSCAVIVTARSQMPDLVGCRIVNLGLLPRDDARTLFAQVTGPDRTLAEPAATEDVLAACAGLPLAIRIAGGRLAARESWTVRALADRLADERRRLDEFRAGNLAVRTSFEVSIATLPESAAPGAVGPARAFRLLGLWAGPSISLPAAAALLGEPRAATAAALDALADTNLLESPAPDRYSFHDLLRVYAADRARTQETEQDRTAAITRVLAWYLHTTEAAATIISPQHLRVPLDPPPPQAAPLGFASLRDALSWCEAERAALTAAIQQAAASGLHEIAWKLAAAAMSFYYRRSHLGDWLATHQIALASARTLADRRAEACTLNNLGMVYGVQHMEEAIACFEQALALSRETGETLRATRAANNLANTYLELGRFEQARQAAEHALELDRRSGDRFGEGLALDILGCACRKLGRYRDAVGNLQQSLAIFRDLDSHAPAADALSELGETYLILGETAAAIACLRESAVIYRDVGDRLFQAITLQRLGHSQRLAGDIGQARRLFTEALQLCDELGETKRAAEARVDLASLADATAMTQAR
jgi:tetratricopeptide (TPR) repeat protein/DNA-binding XRE family transcriptional regulator